MKLNSIDTIIFSPTSGSAKIAKKVADTIAATLPKGSFERQTEINFTQTPPEGTVYIKNSIAVIAAPVYGGRIADLAMNRFDNLKGINSYIIPIAVYGNRDYDDALIELADFMETKNFKVIAGGAFIGEHSYSRPEMPTAEGRPDNDDMAKAEEFGKAVAEKILLSMNNSNDGSLTFSKPNIKGNRPYKEKGPHHPQTPACDRSLCLKCGACAMVCPAGAIEVYSEGPIFDDSLCIKCCACVKNCPGKALTFDTPYTEKLFKNCHDRKEPEFVL